MIIFKSQLVSWCFMQLKDTHVILIHCGHPRNKWSFKQKSATQTKVSSFVDTPAAFWSEQNLGIPVKTTYKFVVIWGISRVGFEDSHGQHLPTKYVDYKNLLCHNMVAIIIPAYRICWYIFHIKQADHFEWPRMSLGHFVAVCNCHSESHSRPFLAPRNQRATRLRHPGREGKLQPITLTQCWTLHFSGATRLQQLLKTHIYIKTPWLGTTIVFCASTTKTSQNKFVRLVWNMCYNKCEPQSLCLRFRFGKVSRSKCFGVMAELLGPSLSQRSISVTPFQWRHQFGPPKTNQSYSLIGKDPPSDHLYSSADLGLQA